MCILALLNAYVFIWPFDRSTSPPFTHSYIVQLHVQKSFNTNNIKIFFRIIIKAEKEVQENEYRLNLRIQF